MARPDTVPPPDRSSAAVADVPVFPPPATDPAGRMLWLEGLARVIELDLLRERLALRRLGLTPLEISAEINFGYRPWISSWTGAVIDKFEAEIIWLAA